MCDKYEKISKTFQEKQPPSDEPMQEEVRENCVTIMASVIFLRPKTKPLFLVSSSRLPETNNNGYIVENLNIDHSLHRDRDATKREWAVNIARDSYASYVGHYPMMAYFAVAENESIGRERYNLMQCSCADENEAHLHHESC
ncbi:hypothetical protein Leryth_024078 [Lithospermum erythrorhizon]|nr:hypothetical protein Leryth_024078 [Lithospermum erythrorhizon]